MSTRTAPYGAVLAVILLTATTAVAQTDPNARDEPLLETPAQVTHAVLAARTGYVAAATQAQDLQDLLLAGEVRGNVWFLWGANGEGLQQGTADESSCLDPGNVLDPSGPDLDPILSLCNSDAVALAVSDRGDRMVVAAQIGSSTTRILQVTALQGLRGEPIDIGGVVTGIDMDAAGTAFTVITQTGAAGGANAIYHYSWSNGDLLWSKTDLTDGPTHLDLSEDGGIIAVGAGDAYRFTGASGSMSLNTIIDSDVTSVAAASDPESWTLYGFESGQIALHNNQGNTNEHKFSRALGDDAQTAVAIKDDASAFAAGDDAGNVRYFTMGGESIAQQTGGSFNLGSSIQDLAFSRDGRYLVAGGADGQVAFYRIQDTGLQLLWEDQLRNGVTSVGITVDGETVLAAGGTELKVYEALHNVVSTPSSADVEIKPGKTGSMVLRLTNEGNRAEALAFGLQYPEGWFAQATPADLELEIGDDGTVTADVRVPDFQAPGRYAISLQHTLGGGSTGSGTFDVVVPEVRKVALAPALDGATSGSITPGSSLSFDMLVINEGNVNDTFELDVNPGERGWSVTLSPASISLGPGETGTVRVDLSAPADAGELDTFTATITPQGFEGQELQFTGTVGARFDVSLSSERSVRIEAGGEAFVPVTVRNDGNTQDSIQVTMGSLPTGWVAIFETGLTSHRFINVAPGDEATVRLKVQAPTTAEVNRTVILTLQAASLADSRQNDAETVLMAVVAPEAEVVDEPDDEESPGAWVLLPALLAAAAWVQRHRNREGETSVS
ncbi:MAG: NEW3 domain-containing protein [Thermoplasmatota archaeon]